MENPPVLVASELFAALDAFIAKVRVQHPDTTIQHKKEHVADLRRDIDPADRAWKEAAISHMEQQIEAGETVSEFGNVVKERNRRIRDLEQHFGLQEGIIGETKRKVNRQHMTQIESFKALRHELIEWFAQHGVKLQFDDEPPKAES